ncbi:tegument protein TRS1 [Mandrillus leucophaeus cytomegalovirus]|uniref:Tegument protein TRS1 n=1 Tax=Mandrillus leucophaeus cytomegalovirus TaxID=1654930 RepID=A0A0G2UI16_9BETA|nr:tegument protein TRS1 [Mandrillus leucophaeus cytomegalovirus]AKI29739.1 tegument protein TRS1 [Mandrillus leucophaeus cytomegalovirus]
MSGRRPHRAWSQKRYAGMACSPSAQSGLLPPPPRHWHHPGSSPSNMDMSSLATALPPIADTATPSAPTHNLPHAPGAPTAHAPCTAAQRQLLNQVPSQRRALTREEYLLLASSWSGCFLANTTPRATRRWCQREHGQVLPLGRPCGYYAVVTPRAQMRDVGATDLRQLSPTDDWIVLIATIVHELYSDPSQQPTLCHHEGLFLAVAARFRVFLFDLPRMTLHLVAADADEFFRYGCGDVCRMYVCSVLPPLTTQPSDVTELLLRSWPSPAAAAAAINHTAGGQTVQLETPGRPPQPWLLTTCWEELERWDPFRCWPYPAHIVAAVRNYIIDRLCCTCHLLGVVTTSAWMHTVKEWSAARNNYYATRSRGPGGRGSATVDTATVKRRPKPSKNRHRGPSAQQPEAGSTAAAETTATPNKVPAKQCEVDEDGLLVATHPMAMVIIIMDELGSIFGYCPQDGLIYPLAEDLAHFLRVGLLGVLTIGRTAATDEQAAARMIADRDPQVWERPRADALYLWPRTGGGPHDLPSILAFLTRPGRWRQPMGGEGYTPQTASPDEDGWRARDAQALGLPPNSGCDAALSDQAQLSLALRRDYRYWRLSSAPEEDENPGEDGHFNELPYSTWAPTDYNPQWNPQTAFGPNTTTARRLSHYRARAGRPHRRPLPVQPNDRDPSHFPMYATDGELVVAF